jgi:citrate synthase
VIKLLQTIQTPEEGVERVKSMLANKIKIPGLGHRVYHTLDPRAAFLKDMAKELGERTGHVKLYEISNAIQQYAKQAKNLNANVDFFSASTYYSLGIPVDLFTPIFAVSRMAGWTAHVLEQYHHNRLIRPRAEYTGDAPGKAWVNIADR